MSKKVVLPSLDKISSSKKKDKLLVDTSSLKKNITILPSLSSRKDYVPPPVRLVVRPTDRPNTARPGTASKSRRTNKKGGRNSRRKSRISRRSKRKSRRSKRKSKRNSKRKSRK